MSTIKKLHKKWSRDSDYRKAFDELKPEFDLARSLLEARIGAGLTQAQLAKRMKTSQSVVARLEGGGIYPSTRTLGKVARATGTRLRISFESARDTA